MANTTPAALSQCTAQADSFYNRVAYLAATNFVLGWLGLLAEATVLSVIYAYNKDRRETPDTHTHPPTHTHQTGHVHAAVPIAGATGAEGGG